MQISRIQLNRRFPVASGRPSPRVPHGRAAPTILMRRHSDCGAGAVAFTKVPIPSRAGLPWVVIRLHRRRQQEPLRPDLRYPSLFTPPSHLRVPSKPRRRADTPMQVITSQQPRSWAE